MWKANARHLTQWSARPGVSGYQRYDYGDGVYGSEAPIAPIDATPATAEDDAYVVITVDTKNWSSACLVFDAKDIGSPSRESRSRVVCPSVFMRPVPGHEPAPTVLPAGFGRQPRVAMSVRAPPVP